MWCSNHIQAPSALMSLVLSIYTNQDMDPIKRKDRTYEWYQMGLFWIAEGFNAAQLEVSSSAFSLGLNPGLCVVACLVGNTIVSIPCAASGYLGSKLGTNFPGTVRASFGMWGSKWAMIVRGVPCIIYYGIQCSLAGQAVQACTTAIWPSFAHWEIHAFPASANITAPQLVSFSIFWLMSLPFLWLPIKTLRYLFVVKSVLVPLFWTALFTWSITAAGGWPKVWREPSKPLDGWSVGYLFGICVNAAISGNATFAVNIMDISRHSKNDTAAWATQLFALPVLVTLTEFLGCTMAVASSVVYGEVQWNPLTVINNFDNRAGKFFAGACFIFFNIMTNVTGNSVPLANDLTGLFPKYINIRRGQFICAVIGFRHLSMGDSSKGHDVPGFLGCLYLVLGGNHRCDYDRLFLGSPRVWNQHRTSLQTSRHILVQLRLQLACFRGMVCSNRTTDAGHAPFDGCTCSQPRYPQHVFMELCARGCVLRPHILRLHDFVASSGQDG